MPLVRFGVIKLSLFRAVVETVLVMSGELLALLVRELVLEVYDALGP